MSATQQPERGTVKTYLPDRGFGFITPDSRSGPDVFVHASVLIRRGIDDLVKGDKVEFEATATDKGRRVEWLQVV